VLDEGHSVKTDPLRTDTDSDLVNDGRERDLGGDPTNPFDAAENKDSDQDGLTDYEEAVLGWYVTVNAEAEYLVRSSPSRPDSDADGLPDLAEQVIGTDPNKTDSDGDGLSDYNEFADFEQLQGLGDGNPGYVIDATASRQYGSDPTLKDSDGDTLTDRDELITGYHILVGTESQPRWIRTDPTQSDTDQDGATDYEEKTRTDGVFDPSPTMTIATPTDFFFWELEVYDNPDATGTPLWDIPAQFVDPTDNVVVTYGDNVGHPGASTASELQVGGHYFWQWRVNESQGVGDWNMNPLATTEVAPACGSVAGALQPTDGTDPDTDDDGRLDGVEMQSATCPRIKDISVTVTFGTLTLDSFPAGQSGTTPEVSWFYTVTPPSGRDNMALVSNACDTSLLCWRLRPLANPAITPTPTCYLIPLTDPRGHYTLTHDVTTKTWSQFAPRDANDTPYRGSYTLTLRPGQTFTVSGILFEYDDAADDCGTGPPPDGNFVPSWVDSGCVTRFSQQFSFSDFDAGGRANFPFPTGQGTANGCDWVQEVFVTAR
jgi:hypothetical protein